MVLSDAVKLEEEMAKHMELELSLVAEVLAVEEKESVW